MTWVGDIDTFSQSIRKLYYLINNVKNMFKNYFEINLDLEED